MSLILKGQNNKPVVAVIGDGSWGTALTKILNENGLRVRWWMRNADRAKYIKAFGHNPHYLTGVQFIKRKLRPSTRIQKVVEPAQIVLLTVPAAFIESALKGLPKNAFEGKIVISAVKGMMPEHSCLVTDYVQEHFDMSSTKMAVISGPCHAEEIAMGRQSYLTVASHDDDVNEKLKSLFACRYMNVKACHDLEGVEYAAVMKNIVAIASGITHALNFGDNFQAVLASNAIQEIKTFLDKVNPNIERNVLESAYLGDLLVTSYSQFSRNRTFGALIGRGYSVKTAMLEMKMVAEGYYAVKPVFELMRDNELELPICSAVYNILYDKVSPALEFQLLK